MIPDVSIKGPFDHGDGAAISFAALHPAQRAPAVRGGNSEGTGEDSDAIFDLSRDEVKRVAAGTLNKTALTAHDYVDIFPSVGRSQS